MTRDMSLTATVTRGSLYLGRDVCERYFAGLQTAVLLRRETDLWVLPVRYAEAGGYLLKLRNAAGDRVLSAPDFFRSHGVNDSAHITRPAVWSAEHAALVLPGIFGLQT